MPKHSSWSPDDLLGLGAQHTMRSGNASQPNRSFHGMPSSSSHLSAPPYDADGLLNLQSHSWGHQNNMSETWEGQSTLSNTTSPHLMFRDARTQSVVSSDLYDDDPFDESFTTAGKTTSANRTRSSKEELPDLFYDYDPERYAKYKNDCSRAYADFHGYIRNSLKKHWARGHFKRENISEEQYEEATHVKALGRGQQLEDKHTDQWRCIRRVLFGTPWNAPIRECENKGFHPTEKPKRSIQEKQSKKSGRNQYEHRGASSTPTQGLSASGQMNPSMHSSSPSRIAPSRMPGSNYQGVLVNNMDPSLQQVYGTEQAVVASASSFSHPPSGRFASMEHRVQLISGRMIEIIQAVSQGSAPTAYSNYEEQVEMTIQQLEDRVNRLSMLTESRAFVPSQHHSQQQVQSANSAPSQARGGNATTGQRRAASGTHGTSSSSFQNTRNSHASMWPGSNTTNYHHTPR